MDPLLLASATELARRIRFGETSSVDVVECHIERIQRVNPRLNAVVRERFEPARDEAKQADERVRLEAVEDLPPLLGVPCTIKENLALAGMPNSAGLVSRAAVVADVDATVVARVRAAGAIPLGVTNLSEATLWPGAFNRVYGQTRNAYRQDRAPGGSSGGEGAIIGSGGSPFGLGTDVGGSIRIPAFANGVFGHKPSGGLVPGTGQFPAYSAETGRFNTTGPLARRAEDLMPLLRVLAGPDGVDAACAPIELGDPDAVDLASLRVTVLERAGPAAANREMRFALQRAAYSLAGCGARVEMWSHRGLSQGLGIYWAILEERGGLAIDAILGDGEPIPVARELARCAIGRSPHTLPVLLSALGPKLSGLAPGRVARWRALGHTLRDALDERLGDDGILLCPSARAPAPPIGSPLREMRNFSFCALFNALELPATQVPMGLGEAGLPLGVQVVAAHGRDHLTIATARALERECGGWVPPGPAG